MSCDNWNDCISLSKNFKSRTVKRTSYNAVWGGIIHSSHSWWSRIQIHFALYRFISWLVQSKRKHSLELYFHWMIISVNFPKITICEFYKGIVTFSRDPIRNMYVVRLNIFRIELIWCHIYFSYQIFCAKMKWIFIYGTISQYCGIYEDVDCR